jgi:Ca-activated chloride channel family protein
MTGPESRSPDGREGCTRRLPRPAEGDRVGLIFFGSAPFVQAPFTEDLKVCRELLDEAQVKMAGPQTAFGDALGLAMTVFDRSEVKERVLIALTDGNDTAQQGPAGQGRGDRERQGRRRAHDLRRRPGRRGRGRAGRRDAQNRGLGDGRTLRASPPIARSSRRSIVGSMRWRHEKAETITHRPRRDVFWWPLAVGLAVTAAQHAIQLVGRRDATSRATSQATISARRERKAADMIGDFHFIRPWWLLASGATRAARLGAPPPPGRGRAVARASSRRTCCRS